MKNTFKFLPRYADNNTKRKNILDLLQGLEIGKKDDKIENYEDFFLFNNIYNSCNEIMRNRDSLNDRDIKTSVHTIVTSSKISNELAYIAENIDGVMEALRNQINSFGAEGDFVKLQETAKAWEKTNKEITKSIEDLKKTVDTNIEKGYGNRFQIRKFEFTKFENSKDAVQKLLENGKSIAEVAKELDLRAGYIEKFNTELTTQKLNSSISLIKEKLESSTPRQEIADELKVPKRSLNKFITEKKLSVSQKVKSDKKPAKQEAPKEKQDKKETEEKSEETK